MLRLKLMFVFLMVGDAISEKTSSIYLERFDNCPGYNNLTSLVKNTQIRVINNIMVVNYDNQILKDSHGLLEFVWEIERCSNKENLDSCVRFTRIRSNKFCSFLETKTDAWSPFIECVHPKMTCPLKKGVYRGKNCTLNASAFKFFPLQGAYWRFRAYILERKLIRMCVDVFGYMKDYYS